MITISRNNLLHGLCWVFILFFVLYKGFAIEHIATRSLKDFDEARYAEVAKNILKTGNWIVPMAGGPDDSAGLPFTTLPNTNELFPYFWKPPLHTIFIALSYSLLGINELAVRFPTLLSAVGALIMIFILSKKLTSSIQISYLSLLLIIASSDFSFLFSQGLAEMQAIFFGVISIYFALSTRKRALFIAGFFGGCAFMTKSFATLWLLPVIFLTVFLYHPKKLYIISIGIYMCTFLSIILPWHVYMYLTFGQLFIDRYIIVNTLGRAVINDQNKAPLHWYFIYMLDVWKTYIFAFLSIVSILIQRIRSYDRAILVLCCWCVAVLIPFSLAQSKVWWYVFPSFIPVTIMLAYGLYKGIKDNHSVLVVYSFVLVLVSRLPYWQLSFSHIPFKPFLLFAACSICISFYLYHRRIRFNTYGSWIFLVLIYILIHLYTFPLTLNRNFQTEEIKTLSKRHTNIVNLAVLGIPYEAILYYFDTGSVSYDWGKSQYVISSFTNTELLQNNGFKLEDKEGVIILMKKEKYEQSP